MGAPQAVTIINTQTGAVLQTYSANAGKDRDGSNTGITYTSDGKYLLFSQDGGTGTGSYVSIASVSATGLLSYAHINVPLDVNSAQYLTTVTCFSTSVPGTNGSAAIPCGQTVSLTGDGVKTSYPLGIAVTPDNKTAYVVLDNNDTLTKIDLTASKPVQGAEVRVGNVPNSVLISPDGKTAYVSNEAGRIAKEKDFQGYSNGTPVVVKFPTGSTSTGTVSVVNLSTFRRYDLRHQHGHKQCHGDDRSGPPY